MRSTKFVVIFIVLAVTFYVGCRPDASAPKALKEKTQSSFVGSANCKSCHAQEYDLWEESHHFHAMEEPSEQTVLGDFDNSSFTADGVRYEFSKKENEFLVTVKEEDSSTTYPIKYTFGIEPLQQYLIDFPDGKVQTLRATWDTEKKEWFHQRKGESVPKHDWLHWSNQAQNWNSMCASCHSTNLEKGLNTNTLSYNTTFSEINVACESCHGPGSSHVEMVNEEGYSNEQTGLFAKAKTNVEQVESCAPCHARRTELTDKFKIEEKFLDHFMPQTINEVFYEKDGQIKEEDYVYASFASSRMYHEDVSCLDCHNPHSNKLKLEGNALCLQCHESTYDRKEHHFHEINTESAQCVNCHMTGKTYMGNDFRRDHSFRIPRPDQSVAHGTSNACNGCHEGKSASWAAENVEKWYGEEREHHFSDDILKGLEGDGYSLVKLINNTAEPAIARATAIEYLERFPLEVFESELSNWARDSSGLVRLELAKFTYNLPLEYKAGIAGMLLKDELRAVRLAAFRSLLLSYNELSETSKKNWRSAEPEYLEFLLHNADFKEGQQNLAQYYSAKQNPEMAIASFEKAIKIDSLFNEPYRNLAVTQSQVGQNEKALNTLNALIQKFPEDERAYYLRSLLHAEENQLSEASEDISVALELNPNPRYFYNAILIEQKLGNVSNASQLLAKALSKYPNDRGLQQLQIN